MFSEWLIDIPEDFETKWFHIVCPTGKRHLVLTGEGETISQTKNGMLMNSFRSFLPGGHPYSASPNEMVLLDTIYNKQSDTYYIMDCMAWNTQYLHQCEAEFRMYWLQEQISQIQGLNQTSKFNWHPFVLLESFPATKEGLEKSLLNVEYEVDGILFFKKSAPYVAGNTENVLWIKPYMLTDVLPDVIVPNYLRKRRPAEFDYEKHKEKVVKEKQERKERGHTARRRPIPQRSINIDKLVDDIGRIYIGKQQQAGVEMSRQEKEIMAKFKQPQGKKVKKSKGQGRGQGVLGDYAYNSSYYGDRYGYDCYGDNYYGNYDDSYYGTYDDFSGYYGDGSSYYGADNYGQYGYGMAGVRDTWGYDDHSRQNKSPQKGRGRGLLDTKPMTAYALTHNIFKK